MPRVHLAKPGEDPIEVYGDAPAPKSALAGCVGPLLIVGFLVATFARFAPALLAAPEPTPLPAVEVLPTVTTTATPTQTPRPTLTMMPTYTVTPVPTATATHTPSPTIPPTWTPTGTRQPWVTGVIANARDLNVRAGPGTGYPVLQILGRGALVRVIARDPGGTWGKIDQPIAGWLHLSYVLPDQPDDLVWLPVVVDPPLVN